MGGILAFYPAFFSVLVVVRNQSPALRGMLSDYTAILSQRVADHELIVVDNGSDDDSLSVYKELTAEGGLPNLQVYALTKEVEPDIAVSVGLENALGDFVVVLDPLFDDIGFLPTMVEHAVNGADVVFASNASLAGQGWLYRRFRRAFNTLYRWFVGVDLAREAPQYRILSKRVVNFILQHRQPALTYRHLPATGGFLRVNLNYDCPPKACPRKSLGDSFDRGMRLLVSTTRGPLRLVTALALFGAVANLLYSVYVLVVALWKADVAPGWISLSLQQSGMFFLISLVLLVIGEYVLHMANLTNDGPSYHIGQEFTSARLTRRERLNVETVSGVEPARGTGLADWD